MATTRSSKRCGVYTRVSTEMQVDRNSLSTQDSQLKEYAERQGWAVARVFTDAGLSAKNTRRPALQEMLQWAREGKLDVILVSKIDRISRNLMDLLKLIDDLKAWGVDFVASSQSFDTTKPTGTLMLNMLGSFAQFEREMTGQRVKENMLERAKTGKWSGGQTPFGYQLNRETKQLEIEPVEAEAVRAMFAEYLQTHSIRKVIFSVNARGSCNRNGKPWARTSLRRLLCNPIYVGTVCYAKRATRGSHLVKQDQGDWVIAENACEAIIAKDDFDRAQALLQSNMGKRAWAETSTHLLSGLLRCGACGGTMAGMRQRRGEKMHQYYRCTARIQKGPSACAGVTCRAGELEAAVVGQIVGYDAQTLKKEFEAYQRRIKKQAKPAIRRRESLEKQYEGFREREARLLELYEESIIDISLAVLSWRRRNWLSPGNWQSSKPAMRTQP